MFKYILMAFYISLYCSGYSLEVFHEPKQCILKDEATTNIHLGTCKLIVKCFLEMKIFLY